MTLTAPDGELQKHRLAVNQLASQALENQATIETLRKEKSAFDDLRVLALGALAASRSAARVQSSLSCCRANG